MRAAAEAAICAKDEFLTLVSHELRNPLNAILGSARLLRSMPPQAIDAEQINQTVDIIERSGKGAAFTITLPVQVASTAAQEMKRSSAISEADSKMLAGVSALVIDEEYEARELGFRL